MANPTLSENAFDYALKHTGEGAMTINGTVNKAIILSLVLMFSAFASVYFILSVKPELLYPAAIVSSICAFIIGLVIIFKKEMSKNLSIIYAVLEGVAVGVVSFIVEIEAFNSISEMDEASFMPEIFQPGIVSQAVFFTFLDLFVMLLLYKFRIIKVTNRLRSVIIGATLCIFIAYLVDFILRFLGFSLSFLHDSSPIGIGISVVIVIVASFNLLLDFNFIEEGANRRAPKYFEWYGAFGLLITLVWLYLEILKLLSKSKSRR